MCWRQRLLVPWTLDLRSLALLRILLGVILLLNFAVRARDVTAFYTDVGVLPRSEVPLADRWVSVHFLGGNTSFIEILLLIQAVAAVAFVLGVSTRLTTLVNWYLLVSLHIRNPLVQNYGDIILAMLLFWGIFLPLGARWSLDAWHRRRDDSDRFPRAGDSADSEGNAVVSLATMALVIQVMMIYVFSAVLKTDPQWRSEFTAVHHALSLDFFVKPLGLAIRNQTFLMEFITIGTMILELIVPFALLIPWKNGPIRCLVVLLFIGFHIGLILAMYLGLFPYVCIAMWLGLLPSWFWNRLVFGKSTTEPLSTAGALPPLVSIIVAVILGFLLLDQTLQAVQGGDPRDQRLSNWRARVGQVMPIRQHWAMFAPKPMDWNGWYVVEAELTDGRRLDIAGHEPQPLRWDHPEDIADSYRDQRWRKYLNNLTYLRNFSHRANFAAWKWREWEMRHPDQPLSKITVWFLRELIHDNGSIEPAVPILFSTVTRRATEE